MDKFLKRIMLVLGIFIALSCFVGCSEQGHVHEYTWYLGSAPTEEENGVLEGLCACGKKEIKEVSNITEKHKHDYQWLMVVAPTTEEIGLLKGVCACGDIKEQELPKLETSVDVEHRHSYQWLMVVAPTTEEIGLLKGVCACGDVKEQELPKLETSVDVEHQHSYQWLMVVAPTTEEIGLLKGVCACGDIKEQELPKLETSVDVEHQHNYQWLIVVAPTTEEIGLLKGVCACGDIKEQELPKLETSVEQHQHSYQWFLIITPTCEQEGLLEGYCGCGEKTEKILDKKEHFYIRGRCNVCGIKRGAIYLDENEKIGYSLSDFVELAKRYNITEDEYQVYESMSNVSIKNLIINRFGYLKGEVNWLGSSGYDEVNLLDVRSDYKIEMQNQDVVHEIFVEDGVLNVVFTDGTSLDYGCVTGLTNEKTETTIDAIAVNKQNQLLLVYSDREVVLVGNIPNVQTDIDESTLIYRLNGDSYTIVGVLDYSVKEIVIPETHRGLPVTEIERTAFYDCINLEKIVPSKNISNIDENMLIYYLEGNHYVVAGTLICSMQDIVIPEKFNGLPVTVIDIGAFNNCTKIKSITIPKSITKISSRNFINCKDLAIVKYAGTAEEWSNILIYKYENDCLLDAYVMLTIKNQTN